MYAAAFLVQPSIQRNRDLPQFRHASESVKVSVDKAMDMVYGVTVAKIESDFGTINLVLDRHMVADAMLTVDLEQVEIAELRGTFYEDLPKSGDFQKGHIINESTIKLLNSYAGSKIIGIGK